MTYGQQRLDSPKKKIPISALEVLAVLYIMHTLLPVVGYYMPSIVYLGVFGITFVLAFPAFYRRGAYVMMGLFAVSLLTLIIKLGNVANAALYVYSELQDYLFGLIALMIIAYGDPRRSRRMFWLVLTMFAITAFTTILGNEKYPQASRMLATLSAGDFEYNIYVAENIGNFTFAYRIVLFVPMLLYLVRAKKVNRILGVAILVLLGYAIFAMEYGMATLLFASCLILLLIPKPTTKKIIMIVAILLVFVLIFGGLVADLFESISEAVDSEALSERFMTVAEVLRGEDKTSSVSAQNRTEFYKKSWAAFINSNLLGAWGNKRIGSPGGHSFVLDALGDFGLVGVLALIAIFVTMYKIALKPYAKQEIYPYLLWTYLIAVVLMVLNPKSYALMFLLVIPLVGHGFGQEERSAVQNESIMDRE